MDALVQAVSHLRDAAAEQWDVQSRSTATHRVLRAKYLEGRRDAYDRVLHLLRDPDDVQQVIEAFTS